MRVHDPRAPLPRRHVAGFTLVEVLVTILITSMLLVGVIQMLNAARFTRDSIHNIQETHLAGPAILDLVEADLRALHTYGRLPEQLLRVKNRVMAGLDGDSLDLVSTADGFLQEPDGEGLPADLTEVGYRLRPHPDDNDFLELFRREGLGVDDEPFEGGRYTLLHDRVRGFDLQVFTEDGPEAEPEESWNERGEASGLPRRIEIELWLELAPRLVREQLHVALARRLVSYRRVVRLPQSLFLAQEVAPVPTIPLVEPPSTLEETALEGAPAPGGEGGGGELDLGGTGRGGGGGGGETPPSLPPR
jgi:type II secretion system protein J